MTSQLLMAATASPESLTVQMEGHALHKTQMQLTNIGVGAIYNSDNYSIIVLPLS